MLDRVKSDAHVSSSKFVGRSVISPPDTAMRQHSPLFANNHIQAKQSGNDEPYHSKQQFSLARYREVKSATRILPPSGLGEDRKHGCNYSYKHEHNVSAVLRLERASGNDLRI